MRLAPITGLFGANSSGKTSLIQLLLLLKQTVVSPDRNQVLNFGDDRSLVSLGAFKEVIHKHASSKLYWKLDWNLPREMEIDDPERKSAVLFSGKEVAFEASVIENGSGRLAISELKYFFSQHEFVMRKKQDKTEYSLSVSPSTEFNFKRTVGRSWALPAPVKCYGFPDQAKAYYQNAGFLSDFQLEFERLFAGMYYLGPLREYPQRQYTWAGAQPVDMGPRGENVVDALLASHQSGKRISRGKGKPKLSLEEYVAFWLRELGLISSFKVKPIAEHGNIYQVLVKKNKDAAEVLITDVGFGVSQILPVLTLCYYVPENSIIILEQPEIHLHPSVQAGLADVFIDAVKNRNVQIILESHSEHLLRRLQRRMAEEQFDSDKTALYFCSAEDGASTLTPLDVDSSGVILNWPKDFFGDEYGEIAATQKAIIARKNKTT
jgi:hypothetical protein